jgi:hypothetical protein
MLGFNRQLFSQTVMVPQGIQHQPNNDLGVITYSLVLFPLYASGINEISSLFV